MTIIKGSKKVTIKEGKDGFGDTHYRATLVQVFNNGLEMEERFIDMKVFSTENRAKTWAEKQLV